MPLRPPTSLWPVIALIACSPAPPVGASVATRPILPVTRPPPTEPAAGCGEPASAPGALPLALATAPPVLADAVLRVGEAVDFAGGRIANELQAPPMWFGEGPPRSSPTLMFTGEDGEAHNLGLRPGRVTQIDGLRILHGWSEARDVAWVHVTRGECPPAFEQEDRPVAPTWMWLSTRGLAQIQLGHNHLAHDRLSIARGPAGAVLSVSETVPAARATLFASLALDPAALGELNLESARLVVSEVVVAETPSHQGEAFGELLRPHVHAYVRFERSTAPALPTFVDGAADPCGAPSPWGSVPDHLVGTSPKSAAASLAPGHSLRVGGLDLSLEIEPPPATGDDESVWGAASEPARPRPILTIESAGELVERTRDFPHMVRDGDSLAHVSIGDDRASLRVDTYRTRCAPSLRAPIPAGPTLVWLGTQGHQEVVLFDAAGDRVRFALDLNQPRGAQVYVSARGPGGGRSLSFTVDEERTPVTLDTGDARIVGDLITVRADAQDPGEPPWIAVALAYTPK